ncbi:uncharacterized protein EDB91DRAFT_839379 [Suillus paluster]|uniref:uncharacterized protein n=1 Tax=Suillus paluster TaxID=48578 RepID=UPI001B87244F|nr:uncharacterized protein EDB91DRAFT_839379 [Suillus paluster]KAG1729100.1 hypothetical protein EDB91DRAFT_839379 [Suillus paluster]
MRKEYYSPVDGDDVNLLDSGTETRPPPKSRFFHWSPLLSHGVLMSITMLFFTLWARAPSIDDVVVYSPANEAIESIGIVRLNGTLNAPSIYRGPSPEVDAAWDRVSLNARPIRMTLEQLLRTGERPSPAMAQYPDEYGGGYMATVEVIHHLHCVDMLRRVTWNKPQSYDHDDESHESHKDFRIHLDHCIEMLRQIIMCRGDVTMITYDWLEGHDDPFPNFNIRHQCRNFEKVLDWVDERRVIVPRPKMVRLEDNVDLPSPP